MVEPLRISLAAARVNAGLKQDEVAAKLGVGKQTIVNWEKGRSTPKFPYLYTLSKMYGVPIDNIILPEESTLSRGGGE